MTKRLVADALMVLSAIFLPWWITAPLIVAGCMFMEAFYEGIMLAAIIDLIYGTTTLPHLTIAACLAFLAGPVLRERVRWYS
ncbi:MAG: hypothetical protein A2675_02675 [Candidatus Yonathbacteria bacterium RIFCSPHIGHO2_01_FULL_51_10]|uniref:Rod shape-determining protein MreD n=1 Tax=Candidatus Yonathbacteria bacterium RIFCSPHIGHO2_01_FULL_51_10 TaxID=1802723 RepID=A0A1G2S6A2_9BACT|nr:MAG: hypothetical protein A2675_02675 [Candidatus Yonathbacteria bacterium RIFCSPHIGHO2_01_FULL_51_10]